MRLDLKKLTTEQRNLHTMDLDSWDTLAIVTEMNREDAVIPAAIAPALPAIAKAAACAGDAVSGGHRVFYVGAGTSGRLGVLDAAECPPTFGVKDDVVIGLIAGGQQAMFHAVEGAEDSLELGEKDLAAHHLVKEDFVIGIAASGRTPYVIGALRYANSLGCHTASIACNKDSLIGKEAQIVIEAVSGPEVLTGSTRLKAGTAQKMILNMISTAAMVRAGKAYQNLMVDVVQSNEKLQVRARNIVMEAAGVDAVTAEKTLQEAGGSCKTAIVMILSSCTKEEALQRLDRSHGHVREAIMAK